MQNIIAQMKLIWLQAEKALKADNEAHQWVIKRVSGLQHWEDGVSLPPEDRRRLGYLHPTALRVLLGGDKATKVQIAKFFPSQ